ncbi:protein terminal ear1 homolog [Tripterygium wilfordii]|uniref:protein terminal ear1 homolog n=1 Tax=Tripterygium wilfordii TaxID=458696 RepID=UPI0018F81C24|nr:protein terminal ear1 homolog [Tripterygium wilfordii]
MEETGFVRFTGSLDPRAQEFRPRYPTDPNHNQLVSLFTPPPQQQPQLYFHYNAAPPPPPLPVPLPPYQQPPSNLPFCFPYSTPLACVSNGGTHFLNLMPPSTAPTRSLLLSSVPSDVSESTVRRELEVFGEVRGVQMERLLDGIVTVHFYDLRHAKRALSQIQEQHLHHQNWLRTYYSNLGPPPPPPEMLILGHPVWAQFIVPASNALPDGSNQGTIVVFNLDPEVTAAGLKKIFGVHGEVKEVRETPLKARQRFVEFFDIRDAAKALNEMNGKEIHGQCVVIEFSRPGGFSRKFSSATNCYGPQNYTHSVLPPSPPPPPPPVLSPREFSGRFPRNLSPRAYLSRKNHGKVNHSVMEASIEGAIGGLSLSGALEREGVDKVSNNGSSKKGGKKIAEKCQSSRRIRPWKGRSGKFDIGFLINEEAIAESNCRDSRTTIMIKNIPNKYSQKLLLNMLDNHCIHCNEQISEGDNQPLSSYNFVYLPIDFNNKCNVGYGFVNMTSPEATWRLYKAFHLQHWEVFNSRKICQVTYARIQGLEALKEHFRSSKFPCENMDHYLPAEFSPPRDGRQLTEPLPIVGHQNKQSITIGLPDDSLAYALDDEDAYVDGEDRLGNSNDDDDDHTDQDNQTPGCTSPNSGSGVVDDDVESCQTSFTA